MSTTREGISSTGLAAITEDESLNSGPNSMAQIVV